MNLGIYSNQMKKELKKIQVSCDRGPTNKNNKVSFNENQLQGVVLTRGEEGPTDRLDYDLRGWEPEEYEYLRIH
ncbi:hypothetical protein BY996DRAFT_6540578 [Phakopsora pachyrhizi]|nr:hypothetical protein BY996DRAFT_6540578 [Phakopsora pachyrhizi]